MATRQLNVLVMEVSGKQTFETACMYSDEELPEPGDVIEVESVGARRRIRARVSRVVPADQFPIRATALSK